MSGHSKLSGRARLCLLVAVARLVGCRCFWLVCPWRWFVGLCFDCFPFWGRRPVDRHFCRYSPLSSGTSVPCTRNPKSAGQFFVNFVMGLMVGDRRFPGATILGARFSTSSANHPVSVPPTGPEHSDASWCGQCTSWQFLYFLMDLSSCAS